jgi:hypothetical protein
MGWVLVEEIVVPGLAELGEGDSGDREGDIGHQEVTHVVWRRGKGASLLCD